MWNDYIVTIIFVQCGSIFRDSLKCICEFYSKNIRIMIKTKWKETKDYG